MTDRPRSPVRARVRAAEPSLLPTRPVALYREQTVVRRVRLESAARPLAAASRTTEPPTVSMIATAIEPPGAAMRLIEPVTRCYPTAMFPQRRAPSAARDRERTARRTANATFARRRWLALAAACSVAVIAVLVAVQRKPRISAQATLPAAESAAAAPTEQRPARAAADPAGASPAAPTPASSSRRPESPPPSDASAAREPLRTAARGQSMARARARAPAAELRGSRPRSARSAAELLARGSYGAALAAYRELAASGPDGNVYGHLASAIERKLARHCAQRDPLGEAPCVPAER